MQLRSFDRLTQALFASSGLRERRLGRPYSGGRWTTEAPAIGFALVADGGLAIPQASVLQDDVELHAGEPGNAMGEFEDSERRLGHHLHLAMADLQRKGRSERCHAGNGRGEKLSAVHR